MFEMRTNKIKHIIGFLILVAVFIASKITILYVKMKQESYLRISINNKQNTNTNTGHANWETRLAAMKLKHMILNNAQKQIFMKRSFKL